jgi:hypothetical protein
MATIRWIVIALATSALAANAAEDVSRLKTFSFGAAPRTAITIAVARQLEAHGLRRSDEHPDVHVAVRRTSDVEYVTYGSGGWGWGYWSQPTGYVFYPYFDDRPWYIEKIGKGTLIVDLTGDDGRLIWRGVGSAQHARPTAREVALIFKTCPATLGAVATTGRR